MWFTWNNIIARKLFVETVFSLFTLWFAALNMEDVMVDLGLLRWILFPVAFSLVVTAWRQLRLEENQRPQRFFNTRITKHFNDWSLSLKIQHKHESGKLQKHTNWPQAFLIGNLLRHTRKYAVQICSAVQCLTGIQSGQAQDKWILKTSRMFAYIE